MNIVGVFLLFVALSGLCVASESQCDRPAIKAMSSNPPGEIRMFVDEDGRMIVEFVREGEAIRNDIVTDGINYGRAIVDLALADPLLIRSPLGDGDDGAPHFDIMVDNINRAVDQSGKRELLEWFERASAKSEDFFFNSMAEMLIQHPGASTRWLERHIYDEGFLENFILIRNLYWITFTLLMDAYDLCEPMAMNARRECYLWIAKYSDMTE